MVPLRVPRDSLATREIDLLPNGQSPSLPNNARRQRDRLTTGMVKPEPRVVLLVRAVGREAGVNCNREPPDDDYRPQGAICDPLPILPALVLSLISRRELEPSPLEVGGLVRCNLDHNEGRGRRVA